MQKIFVYKVKYYTLSITSALHRKLQHNVNVLKHNFSFDINMDCMLYRQVVARTILETLRVVTDEVDDVAVVLNVMSKLADDVGKI